MSLVLVDTDILIDIGRNNAEAISTLNGLQQRHSLAVSVVTQMELIVGCRNKEELRQLEQFLQGLEVLPVDAAISSMCIDLLTTYRLSHGLLIADGLIAATAIVHDAALASKNQRDYRFIAGLTLLPYPTMS